MTPDCSITVRSAAEAVAYAPYVIGFHPTDSIVVLCLARRIVVVGMRYDLPPPAEALDDVAEMIALQRAPEVIVLGYGPPPAVTPAVHALLAALEPTGVRVTEALRITEGRWWSYTCADPSCCPPDGTPCRSDLAAEAVYRGLVALPDRKALVARVAPAEGAVRREMAEATVKAQARFTDLTAADVEAGRGGRLVRKAGRQAIREAERVARAGRMPSCKEVAWLGVLMVESVVLDYALERSGPEEWRMRLWNEVLRLVDPVYAPGPACVLGFAAWQSGDGALARVALDRALRENPGNRIAGALDRILSAGIGPTALVALHPPGTEPSSARNQAEQARAKDKKRGRPAAGAGRRIRRGTRRQSL
ncbi:hypothetical protein GCM10010172_53100 [Paractinoplanes ferrugineus]|uniref:DUF4192 domain-containing protein n=1 Tax=Paractinoplanes ferrugineus TaxID=113564 RepID=A0A919J790_9ACTN|nr:DUF4192 domain-containing protein [Actinoplanes ferrugineus]GIE11871.1 hypothetical protein Afe05nite_37110 [Actinoplanes ferrugineus]